MGKWTKRGLIVVAVFGVIWFALGYVGAEFFVMPKNRDFADKAEVGGQPVEPVTLETQDGITIAGWHVRNESKYAVLFTHGIGGDRRQGNRTAGMYVDWGFSVLMLDARGHGKSDPAPCTIGWTERHDILAGLEYLEEQGYERIGAHGISLGAATIVYSLVEDPGYDFYDTADNALRNRLAMFNVPYTLSWPFRLWTEWKTGLGPEILQPLKYIDRADVPVLIVAGDSEPELKVGETKALFERCGAEEKTLHWFQGGKHELFARRFTDEYRTVLGEFITARKAAWSAPQETFAAAQSE